MSTLIQAIKANAVVTAEHPQTYGDKDAMRCTACQSLNLKVLYSEIALHVEGIDNPCTLPVMVFPQLTICLDCGLLQGRMERDDLMLLRP